MGNEDRSFRRNKKRRNDKHERMYVNEFEQEPIKPAEFQDQIVEIKKVARRQKDDNVDSADDDIEYESKENVQVIPQQLILTRRINFVKPKK
jgi:hypothetical protein